MTLLEQSVKPAELKPLLDAGKTICLIDVRTPGEYARLHARGAVLRPLRELQPQAVATLRRDPSEPIYLICQSGNRSESAARRLREAGIEPVFTIQGGTAAWDRSGLPVELGGGHVISLERQVRIGAGSLVLVGCLLSLINVWFIAFPIFIASGLIFAGITDWCGMALLLARLPWNRGPR